MDILDALLSAQIHVGATTFKPLRDDDGEVVPQQFALCDFYGNIVAKVVLHHNGTWFQMEKTS